MPSFFTLQSVAARAADGSVLFENLTFSCGAERIGLVGRNGSGKTTLLRIIAGDLPASNGAVTRAGRIALLPQMLDPAAGETIAETLGVADVLAANARLLRGEGDADDLAQADWSLDERLGDAFARVELAVPDLARETQSLSGGERTRLALARLLLDAPNVILLDEPTNNLDATARAIVARVLETWRGGAIVTSHDRALLRRVDRIVELSDLGAKFYGGNFDLYAERRRAERALAEQKLESAERERERVAGAIQQEKEKKAKRDSAGRRARADGGVPKMVLDARAQKAENTASRQSRTAERLRNEAEDALETARADVERVRLLAFGLPSSGLPNGRVVLSAENVSVATPEGSVILRPTSLSIVGPERIAISGPNGAGKTTLLRLIAGEIAPSSGSVARRVPAALLDQHAAMLDPDRSLLENFLTRNPQSNSNVAYAALARFLFRNVQALRKPRELSGGERLRAALACTLGGEHPPQLLLLDEPTNHLDLDSVAAIEAALGEYDGALIVVSHDEDFLEAVRVERRICLDGAIGSRSHGDPEWSQ
jgi:ATPase subunit of ABC transporter with duplicated ATPase domains